MNEKFEEMLCFAAVCSKETFTSAAILLGCSKSHVSRKISNMEKRLSTKLFRRTTRKIYLTHAGELLKEDALKILNSALNFEGKTKDINNKLEGRFVITAPVSISTLLIAPLISKLQRHFPDIDFDIIPTNDNLKIIEKGVDLAIRTGSVVDEQLVARHIADVSNGFYTSCANLEKFASLEVSDLSKETILVNQMSADENFIEVFDVGVKRRIRLNERLVIREFPTMASTLFNTEYIAWLPNYFENYQHGDKKLVRLFPALSGKQWPVYLVFPFQTPISLKLEAILSFFEQELFS